MKQACRTFDRKAIAWSLYDFANSAYALLITGVGYQLYFKRVLLGHSPETADALWGLLIAASIISSAILSPIIGISGDRRGLRDKWFVLLTVIASLGTASLALPSPSHLLLSIVLFLFTNLAYNLALFLYDSYLTDITTPSTSGTVSGFGWGLGYVGGLCCLAIAYPLIGGAAGAESAGMYRLSFVLVGMFFFAFAVPALRILPSRASTLVLVSNEDSVVADAVRTTLRTLRNWREKRDIFRFLAAYWCITEGLMTTIYFTSNYLATTFGSSMRQILLFTVVVQAVAIPATWASGWIADRWSLRGMLRLTVTIWGAIVMLLAYARSYELLYFVFGLMGLVLGSTQALGRSVLANIVPKGRSGEFFAYNSLSTKVAATLGPVLFGLVSSATGSQRLAWLSLLPFFVVGLWLLARVPADAEQQAQSTI